ncbi:hypothetical protein M0R45_010657 [Rubus argutus]|uniref:Isopenicillin N synthase-like Fe(2+) 2OG dioxygenase domain-containing protein n=1 Tax=Rubus argutus TaxID=59490 RepID=A0AAW1Y8K4_RUBAR
MVFKSSKKCSAWLAVEPVPNAFVVNIGHTLQIISNGKLSRAEHRVVTNKKVSRMSVVSCIHPSGNCRIEPAILQKHFLLRTLERLPPLERYKLRP